MRQEHLSWLGWPGEWRMACGWRVSCWIQERLCKNCTSFRRSLGPHRGQSHKLTNQGFRSRGSANPTDDGRLKLVGFALPRDLNPTLSRTPTLSGYYLPGPSANV